MWGEERVGKERGEREKTKGSRFSSARGNEIGIIREALVSSHPHS